MTSDTEPAPIAWVEDGWAITPDSIEELLTLPMRLAASATDGGYVWRGQGDAAWPISSSLQRHIRDKGLPLSVDEAERSLIELARSWGLGIMSATHIPDLQLLALMQHHGVPTRLVDVSHDPLTALWFAASSQPGKDGMLFAFSVAPDIIDSAPMVQTHAAPTGDVNELDDPLSSGLYSALDASHWRPTLVEPTIRDDRMTAQQGAFLMGRSPHRGNPLAKAVEAFRLITAKPPIARLKDGDRSIPTDDAPTFLGILVPHQWKPQIIKILEPIGKSYQRLYPDWEGLVYALKSEAVRLKPPATKVVRRKIRDEIDAANRSMAVQLPGA